MMLLALAAIAILSSSSRQQSLLSEALRWQRELQTPTTMMEGECTGNSILQSGEQYSKGSYLCYNYSNTTTTTNNDNDGGMSVIYKFGIDTNNQLSYYMNDEKIWHAAIIPSEDTASTSSSSSSSSISTACIVFGDCDTDDEDDNESTTAIDQDDNTATTVDNTVQFFRLQAGGSLAAYNAQRTKIWDSHNVNNVDGSNNNAIVIMDKISGSILQINEKGVVIR